MKLFNWIFNKKTSGKGNGDKKEELVNPPAKDSGEIKVFDKYGREFYITKEQWKNNVLIGNLEKAKNNPDELYSLLVGALQDGFLQEGVVFAERLAQIDPVKSRGTTLLGIFYMESNRLGDAEKVFTGFINACGEDGVLLTNLAKVYDRQGNAQKAEAVLWHALEVDPNQENGLNWYAAIQNERSGQPAFIEAFKRVAALDKSWRAQLWLARFALQEKDIHTARKLYKESIENAGSPLPGDLLMQMSGDLGNNGYFKEIIDLVQPHYQPIFHGIMVGNNLIKTYVELGQLNDAKVILDQLYHQNRPDWHQTLSYWDKEIAKKEILIEDQKSPGPGSVAMFSIDGPIWCPDSAIFAKLIPPKDPQSIKIFIFGNTIVLKAGAENTGIQLADAPGRASRAIPLFLSEQITLATSAEGHTLIPWMQSKGFAVMGKPYAEKELCQIVEKNNDAPDFILNVVIDITGDHWEITVNIIRRIDYSSLEKITAGGSINDFGSIVLGLSSRVIKSLVKHSGVKEIPCPYWYAVPSGVSSSDYLLRLEQLLAVTCMNQALMEGGGLYGEHEIIQGILFLNLSHPDNSTVRMLLAQILVQMKKFKPEVVDFYKEKVMLLQREYPLGGMEGELISKTISGTLQVEG